jgi:hypothetical protein
MDDQPKWQPIDSIATFLCKFAKEKTGKHDYLDVTVRKAYSD